MNDTLANKKCLIFTAQQHHYQKLQSVIHKLAQAGVSTVFLTSQNGNNEFSGDFELPLLSDGVAYQFLPDYFEEGLITAIRREKAACYQAIRHLEEATGVSNFEVFSDLGFNNAVHELAENYILLQKAFEQNKPDFVLILHEGNFWTKLFAYLAHKLAIPVFSFQEGFYVADFFNVHTVRHLIEFSDLVFLWGDDIRQSFLRFTNYPEKLPVVGAPHTDALHETSSRFNRKSFCAENALSDSKKIITLMLPYEVKSLEIIVGNFAKLVRFLGAQGLIKFRPATSFDLYTALQKAYAATDLHFFYNEDPYPILMASDAVITGNSSVGFEAILLGAPLIYLDIAKHQDFYNYQSVALGTVTLLADDQTEFNAVKNAIHNISPQYHEQAARYIKQRYVGFDGKVTDRIVSMIGDFLGKRQAETQSTLPNLVDDFLTTYAKPAQPHPTISVVIPCYNYARYLPETVNSVLNQTYRDFEIIIVNDGSTDETETVAEQLISANPDYSIRLISQPNSGQPAISRNVGITAARGSYILCLDADDTLAPTMLEACLDVLTQNGTVAIAYTDRLDFDGVDQVVQAGEYDFERLKVANHISYCALYKKEVWEAVGGYRTNVKGIEDWDFWVAAGARGYHGYRISQPLFKYRRHDTGVFQEVRADYLTKFAQLVLNNQELYRPQDIQAASKLLGLAPAQNAAEYPLVSVIIPTHNRPEMLAQAISSVLTQTFTEFEVIVVNDGGVDVADVVARLNDRGNITYLSQTQNKGPSAARNLGIKNARGKYIALLDDDDLFYPTHLEIAINHLNQGYSVVYTDASRVTLKKQDDTYHSIKQTTPYSIDFDRNKLLIGNISPINCFVFERKLALRVGLFDETLGTLEDWDFWIKLSKLTDFKHLPIQTVQVNWRPDGSTLTTSRGLEFRENREIIYQRYRDDIKQIPNPQQILAEFHAIWSKDSDLSAPATSIIILTHNQLEHTKLCLASIAAHTPQPHEVIVVDNGSTDGTLDYLRAYAGEHPHIRLIANADNRGFAAGNNQGLTQAKGDYVLLLNNDTVVTEGWLARLLAVLDRHPEVGLVGPMSNHVSGPQVVPDVPYTNLEELHHFAGQWAASHAGQSLEFIRLVGFCLLARRAVIERIGGLDEQFGSGNFEDDDFCLRAAAAGFKSRIAQDVFIHHTGGQTFKAAGIDYMRSLEHNWQLFKTKWQLPANLPCGTDYRPYLPPVTHLPSTVSRLPGATTVGTNGHSPTPSSTQTQSDKPQPIGGTMAHDGILNQMIASAQKAGRWQQAISLLQEAVKYAPAGLEQAELWNSLGFSCFQAKQIEEAEDAFKEGLQNDPHSLNILLNLIHLYREQEQLDQATATINRALRVDPDNVEVLLQLGECAIELEAIDVAQMTFERIKGLAPDTPGIDEIVAELAGGEPAYNRTTNGLTPVSDEVSKAQQAANQVLAKGQAALEANDLTGAAQDFAWVIAQYPDLAAGHMALGSTLLALGRIEAAITPLRRVTELLPELAAGYNQLGIACYRAGRQAEAETAFKQARQFDPFDLESCLNLIDLYRGQQRFEEARAAVEVALDIKSNHPEVQVAAGLVSAEMGDFAEARRVLLDLEGTAPSHPGVTALRNLVGDQPHQNLALMAQVETAQATGNWSQAVTLLKAALTQAGHQADPALWNSLGVSYFQAGQIGEAEIAFVHGLKLDPENLDSLSNLADFYLQQEQFGRATEYVNKALRIDPNHIEALIVLGHCCIQLGVYDTALAAFRQVRTLAPDTEGVDQVVAELESMTVVPV